MNRTLGVVLVLVALALVGAGVGWYLWESGVKPSELLGRINPPGKPPIDGPGKTARDFPEPDTDFFKPMDGGIALSPEEIKGRNAWILWTGGNEQFWGRMARESYGLIDFLKTIDSRGRKQRFEKAGLVNEPGTAASEKPDEFGLFIDHYTDKAPAGLDESVYGRTTGIIGFRLYPNPDFNEEARRRWDPDRFYNDPSYYLDRSLVRPYRVGMTCGICHVAPHPLNPPADPAEPKWENLASVIGNQYFREGAALCFNLHKGNFLWEMVNAQPPGTSDTSRIATDHNNNPNVMNAIFNLDARLAEARSERMAGGNLDIAEGEVAKVPHVLKDGADSVGLIGATIRVYVNIGMYGSEWTRLHNPLVGMTGQRPFKIKVARENSVYWRATEERAPHIAAFFKRIAPMHLADAPGGKEYLQDKPEVVDRGKQVFAENCARCHSSKRPPAGIDPDSPEAAEWFAESVRSSDFLENNFLSDDRRNPVTSVGTNSARAMGTNAKHGHIWEDFSSQTYKELKPVGTISTYNPADPSTPYKFEAPGGGMGYYRTPSLVSIWATAPFLHNNALGKYTGDPSVKGRMEAFDDAVHKLLWPDRRLKEGSIWRTVDDSYFEVAAEFLPKSFAPLLEGGYLKVGPIPKGTPINLLANLDPDNPHIIKLAIDLKRTLLRIKLEGLNDEAARKELAKLVPDMLAASKCPDLVEDRGHTFGVELSDADKEALIAFLKTF